MNRYQIYLNPQSVDVIDQVAQQVDASRSQIIRDVIDRMAKEYRKLLAVSTRRNQNPLLEMAGFAKSPTGNISTNIDSIYLAD